MSEETFDKICRAVMAIMFVAGAAVVTSGCVYVSSSLLRGAIVGEIPSDMEAK